MIKTGGILFSIMHKTITKTNTISATIFLSNQHNYELLKLTEK